jgi:bifunctional non-homologous end joining protein LigD
MLAVLAELPAEDAGFGYEFKWDGVRLVSYVLPDRLRLLSRSDRDVTGTYPELAGLVDLLGGVPAVLDGEVVAYAAGRPSFAALQERMHVRAPSPQLAARVPVTYHVFDVLHLGAHSTLGLPYAERRGLLAELALSGPHVRTPPWFDSGGADVLAASTQQGLEGVVAKRLAAPYLPGRRSPDWRKVKDLRTVEVLVGGWRPGEGRRAGLIGSLLLGLPETGGVRYVGHVGTGFTEAMLRDLGARLAPLARGTSPFAGPLPRDHARGARWVQPLLVGEVAYGEWTGDGILRHPSWRGLRPDKDPAELNQDAPP